VESLPWLVIETYVSKISFYRNIVRKNASCDMSLGVKKLKKNINRYLYAMRTVAAVAAAVVEAVEEVEVVAVVEIFACYRCLQLL